MRQRSLLAAVQLVDYQPSARGEALVVAEDDRVRTIPLDRGTTLAYALGERHCAGVVDGDEHIPCDRSATPHCEYHTSTWVCARCTGTCLKDEMDCYDEHAVYIAAFAPETFKVGVTKRWRLETRLREQGADRAAHIRTVENGRIAREIEADIATRLVDRVRAETKIRALGATVDEATWETLLADFDVTDRYTFEYGLDLDSQPVPETIAAGTVRGVVGRLLVLDRNGTTYAVDLRELVGYELEPGGSDRRLQSSLGSF